MSLRIEATHGGGKKIDAHVGDLTIHTDQPKKAGGEGSAPAPYALFLSSLATCAGFYVIAFCQARGIPTDQIRVVQDHTFDPKTHRLAKVDLQIELPPDFPEKYRAAVARAASACAVKKVIENPPELTVEARAA